ncbi:hypothetical protein Pfo_001656 [Paulownia fortunei]|nr:hypothetical protein Pfo_001656 [Paulownia fortunei]
MEGDDRTFRADFTNEGVTRLRERINEKLKEFMGDYTDDTLVEYVIVLLKNGRRKDEAKSELDVFLGDDSDSFVSWLWDHLGSNLSLYVQQRELRPDGAPKIKSAAGEHDGRTESHQIESDAEKGKRTSGKRHNREWKGLVRDGNENENPLPQSSMPDKVSAQVEPNQRVGRAKRCLSPRPTIEKKRRRHEEPQPGKREVSQTTVSAPRRLLQFAVRDAVATSRQSDSTADPSFMRLRSVVSTSTGDSFHEERPQRNRPVPRLRTAMSAAIKAVAEAVKDVSKIRPSRNVFDRLGCATDVSNTTNHLEEYRGVAEDGVAGDFSDERVDVDLDYQQQNGDNMQQEGNMLSFHDDPIMSSDLGNDGEGYDDVHVMGQGATDISQHGTSGGDWVEDSLMFHYSETDGADERVRRPHNDLDQPAALPSASFKIASLVNVSTRKSQYQVTGSEMDNHKLIQDTDTVAATNSQVWLMEENSNPKVAFNGNAKPDTGSQHESQKTQTPTGLCSTGQPTEDADSRTIFVSNVHFAATKDSLSRHFNKFGEVLKVIILTDQATGQPKGSAYIEFIRKEAAEQALSLDGTSFMSRILKIVRKNSAQPDAASVKMWPRIARASPSAVPRFGRVPFARGIPSLYRPRIPIKPGARSFQWKREAQPTVTEAASGQASNSIVPQPPPAVSHIFEQNIKQKPRQVKVLALRSLSNYFPMSLRATQGNFE